MSARRGEAPPNLTSLPGAVIDQFVQDWFRDPSVGERLAMRAATSVTGIVRAGIESAVLEINDDPSAALRSAFGIASDVGDEIAARAIAKKLKRALPPHMRSLRSAALSQLPRKYASPPSPEAGSIGPIYGATSQILELLQEPLEKAARAAQLPTERWSIEFLKEQFGYWRARLDVMERQCETEAGRKAIAELRAKIDFESSDVPRRRAIAEAIRDSGRGAGFRGSTAEIGIQVHRELQSRYCAWRWYHTAVSEWWVYTREAGVGVKRKISEHHRKVFDESGGRDPTFAIVETSRLTPFRRDKQKYLLWDMLDMTLEQIWEIKPLGSAPEAVVQETYYRLAYEFFVVPWLCFGFEPSVPRMGAGDEDFPVRDPHTGDPLVRTLFATALPFTCNILPGIVLYAVLRRKHRALEKLLETIRAFREAVEESLRKLKEILRAIDVILLFLAVVVFVLIVLYLIFLLNPQPAPGKTKPVQPPEKLPAPGGGEQVPSPGSGERVRIPKAALRITGGSPEGLILSLPSRDSSRRGEGSPLATPVILHFGGVTVDGIAAGEVGALVTQLSDVLSDALEAMEKASVSGEARDTPIA